MARQVQPLEIVGEHHQRPLLRGVDEQGQGGQRDQKRFGLGMLHDTEGGQ